MELSEHTPAATLSVDTLLEQAVEQGASDLHLTVGIQPVVRRRGHIEVLHEYPMLDPDLMRQLIYRITTTEQQKHLELGRQLDFAYGIRGVARFRVNAFYQRGSLAAAFRDLAARARAKQLGPDDLAGGTFTITNPGAAGTWISVPILNSPQVGILSTDGVAKTVVAADDRLRIAPVANLCLTFDHRALDGAYAGAFLRRLREIVEQRDWAAEL